nr:hypothetical protein [Tanacetum cinerariifolium]
AYKEYYTCATGVATPKPKASARKKKDEGDKNDESDAESDDGSDDGNVDDNDETVKDGSKRDEDDVTMMKRKRLPRLINKRIQKVVGLSDDERIQEEEEAEDLYRDVNINQGRGLQVSQNIEDSHVTLTLVHPDGLQESSLVSSFVTSMLNPISDAADLSEMELKKILIDKMEGNKSIQRSDEQRNLYKALVEAYDADRTILDTYGESTILKRRREDDDQEEPSAGSDQGSKRRREGGEHASASTPSETATKSAGRSTTWSQSRQLSASVEDQPIVQTSQYPKWFSQPRRPPTPDRDWNKTLPAAQGNAHVDTLTPELLAGPTFELMRGSCNSLTELEYHIEEVYKATTDQLDWVNPKGQQYPHNLLQPLPLIPERPRVSSG